ncbi:MAG: tetratricopeptide repeat protein, partial [Cyanobacteriota bacterium]|nr:tetratricopeptide repeat protein [Cyanobacteriota bacterium]
MLDRNDNPWYPTARLFRQPKIEDWDSVFLQVKQALIEFIESQMKLTERFEIAYQYYQQNNWAAAERICRRVLEEKPQYFDALHLLAVLEYLVGRNETAINLFHQVINLRPNFSQGYSNLGNILKKEGRLSEAIAHYQTAISLEPSDSSNYSNLGLIFLEKGQIESAIIHYEKSREINPDNSCTNLNLGFAWEKKGDLSKASTYYQQAIKINPNYAEAWYNLGHILRKQGHVETAIEHYQKSLELNPDYTEAYNVLGFIFLRLGKVAKSQKYYEQALKLDKNYVNAHFGLAVVLLKQGNFIQGFSEYEWRCLDKNTKTRSFSQPLWDGSNFQGKTLLVYTEQGLGDSIQFIRYIPLVKKLGGWVIVECNQPELKLLFTTVSGIDELFVSGEKLLDFDLQIPLLSLPRVFGTTPETIPAKIPYLSIPKSTPFQIPPILEKKFKVGIFWQTSSTTRTSQERSCSIQYFRDILNIDIDTANFYILQKEVSQTDLEWLNSQTQIHNLSSSLNDLADTAAAIKQLDLVITIDTVIAHLAGALGKPVWVMLNFDSDWRWLIDREDSPWYPTMRLFRQSKIGDWDNVFEQVKDNLKDLLENSSSQNKMPEIMDIKFYNAQMKQALKKYKSGNWKETVSICQKIVKKQPNNFLALELLGVCAYQSGEIEQAIAYYRESLKVNPNYAETHNNLAVALQDNQEIDAALNHCQTAINFRPNYPEAWHNLGRILRDKGQFEAAIEHYQKSLELKPNYAEAYNSLGSIFLELGKLAESQKYYQEAIKLDKNYVNARFGLAVVLLKQGDFTQGFSEYEWRYQRQDYITHSFSQPLWDGSNFQEKTLLVYTEQGLGDSIQFIRYIPLVKKLGGRVIVGCNEAGLKLLFTTVPEIDELFVIGEELPDFDLQIPLMSLPRIFRTTLETIPAEIPYLFAPESKKIKLPETGNSFKIGITWETNSQTKTSKKRSCSIADFQSILNVDNASFYILQKEVSPQDLEWLNSQTKIHNLSSYFNDLTDTAAVIKQLDLVITIDTVIAHLAGALGKPVWVILNFDSDWRWLTDREDSPWYPTMRLFRQSKSDDWQEVCREIVDALSSKLLNFNQTDYPSIIQPGSSVTTQQLLTTALEKYQVENWKEAEKICQFIIQYQPHCAAAFEILVLCAKKAGKIDLEITYHQKAINFNPNNYQTHLRLAVALKKQQKLERAIVHNQKAIELKPNDALAWHNLGQIFKIQGNIPEAIRCFKQSLEIEPNNADVYNCWGNLLKEQGNLTEAKVLYEKSLELNHNYINAHFARGFILLKQGDFLAGFSEYEWRCKRQDYITRGFAQPVWDGSNFQGKTLLVYTEQGLGDSIQFIRYIPLVKKLGGRIIVECNKVPL